MDDRDKSTEVTGEVLRFYADKDPAIIVGFLVVLSALGTGARRRELTCSMPLALLKGPRRIR